MEVGYNDVLRDIYDSEELKIDTARCSALKSTIETLCTRGNRVFLAAFEGIAREIDIKRPPNTACFKRAICSRSRGYQLYWSNFKQTTMTPETEA